MFKENNKHLQQSFFTSLSFMNNAIHKKLINSWASVFYHVVFCEINERNFSVLYCNDNGRPNFPVNILLCLEYIKHLFNYSDAELVDQFYFNYQIGYALGIKSVGEINLASGTLIKNAGRLAIIAQFSKETCESCEFKNQCCVKTQVKSNKFSTTVEAIEIQNKRDEIKNDIKENCSKRTAIEGTNSELKRGHNLNTVMVLGIVKVLITTGLKITACNIKRFAKNAIKKITASPINQLNKGIVLQN